VLIYAGTYDWICNWVSEILWLEVLEWSSQAEYNREKFQIWGINEVDASVHEWLKEDGTISEKRRAESGGAGITKRAGPLTFTSIWGGGHMMSSLCNIPSG
jgi:carboxypeptidase C (cathepsin A)